MRKLKATVAVLVDNDKKKMETISKLYMNNSRLYLDDNLDNSCIHDKKYILMDFFDRDERKSLRRS